MEFDKSKEFKEELEAAIIKLKQMCYDRKIPMFATFAIKNQNGHTEYRSEMISAGVAGVSLSDDRIPHMVNVLNGFMTVPPTRPTELDFDT